MKEKAVFIIVVFSLLLFIVWLKLFSLQIIKGKENQALAEENRIKIEKIKAPRGIIYDCRREALVRNRPEGREYLYPEALAHVLGFVAEIAPEEIETEEQLGSLVGKLGIEKQYDRLLRGKDGGILVEVGAEGEIMREIKRKEPQAGGNLNLTLDLELQKAALGALQGKKGALIASEPQTGKILSLVSSPSFNPNLFTLAAENEAKRTKEIERLLASTNQAMFNRAIAGLYPPGSTFKIVTAIAGLEEGKIDQNTEIEDQGEIEIGPYTFGNWYYYQYGRKEGQLDIVKAIKRSNDIFFYRVGEWLGISKLSEWAVYFGLGQPLGIDLPGEAGGLVPTPEWKKEQQTEGWYLGDTFITAIGQGDLQLTPLQVNQLAGVIASQGKFCRPHLVADGPEVDCQSLAVKPDNLALVKEGMKEACQEGGTGWPFFDFEPSVGCKTGTAEISQAGEETHAWFTVFAPVDKPEIVVTVLLEKGGEGSADAAPVAKEVLKTWFDQKS